jgi:antitoxin component YwqK of YwqJK toxin-antitoxin module
MIKLSQFPLLLVLLGLSLSSQAQSRAINQRDDQGRRHGLWKKTYSSGKLRYQGQFKHGVPVDTFRHYFDNGQLRTLNVFRGRSGTCMSYQYGEDKLLAGMGLYRDKKKDSVWTFFDRDSNVVAREAYDRGQRQGPSKKYFENGQLAEITHYEKDQKEGPWKQFYQDGTLKSKAHYRGGKLRGEATFFHPNGRPRLKGKYVAGKMHGIWYFFTRKGKIEKKQRWRYGFKVALDGSKQPPADSVKDTSTVAPMPHW